MSLLWLDFIQKIRIVALRPRRCVFWFGRIKQMVSTNGWAISFWERYARLPASAGDPPLYPDPWNSWKKDSRKFEQDPSRRTLPGTGSIWSCCLSGQQKYLFRCEMLSKPCSFGNLYWTIGAREIGRVPNPCLVCNSEGIRP